MRIGKDFEQKNRQDYDSVFPLIAAAGKGSRSGMNAQINFKVSGIPIIPGILKHWISLKTLNNQL